MTRTALLATSALSALFAAPALADNTAGNTVTGIGDVGYNDTNYDDFGTHDIDAKTFHGAAAALWSLGDNWNAQGDVAFNSDRLDSGGEDRTTDVWRVGGAGFWRDSNRGLVGAELWYQSYDISNIYFDGYGIAARGDLYASEQLTLGVRVGYAASTRSIYELDEASLNAYGKYYVQPDLALTLGANYTSWDATGDGGEQGDADDWSLNGEAEYLIPDGATSIYAALSYGGVGIEHATDDSSYVGFGVGLRVHFGTAGSLEERQRSGPLEKLPSARFIF